MDLSMTHEQAERFLDRVGYASKFPVNFRAAHGGYTRIPVMSVEELLKVGGNLRTAFGAEALAKWIRKNFGDDALADLLVEECSDLPPYVQAPKALEFVAERYHQAIDLLVPTPVAAEN